MTAEAFLTTSTLDRHHRSYRVGVAVLRDTALRAAQRRRQPAGIGDFALGDGGEIGLSQLSP